MNIKFLIIMLFLHIVDDYYLQGFLANAKHKNWWIENCPHELYQNDYKMALIEHAFSWTFMTMLPAMIMNGCGKVYIIMFILNWVVHGYVDNLKANKYKINLIQDQLIHVGQIVLTWIVMFETH